MNSAAYKALIANLFVLPQCTAKLDSIAHRRTKKAGF